MSLVTISIVIKYESQDEVDDHCFLVGLRCLHQR